MKQTGLRFFTPRPLNTLGDVPAIGVESSRVDISRQLPHLPTPFNPAVMAAQLGMFSNPQLLNMMQYKAIKRLDGLPLRLQAIPKRARYEKANTGCPLPRLIGNVLAKRPLKTSNNEPQFISVKIVKEVIDPP
ncbi:unnamed protein product [Strongylus vulgaris]|uniref:Uncharacterized protein n=1 Tax=Strongylus vulgaris TaxID=40348 RepID=A0A3P7I567_STRVU|nr:unnamed protein product [Strongylus vulgaris]